MTDGTTDAALIAELEIRLAHHEQTADELSAVVAKQADQIDALRAQLRRLTERLQALEQAVPRPTGDEPPPPHY
jgi:SlyX protein